MGDVFLVSRKSRGMSPQKMNVAENHHQSLPFFLEPEIS